MAQEKLEHITLSEYNKRNEFTLDIGKFQGYQKEVNLKEKTDPKEILYFKPFLHNQKNAKKEDIQKEEQALAKILFVIKLYSLFNVSVPNIKIVTYSTNPNDLEKKYGLIFRTSKNFTPLNTVKNGKFYSYMDYRENFFPDILPHAVLNNFNVAGNRAAKLLLDEETFTPLYISMQTALDGLDISIINSEDVKYKDNAAEYEFMQSDLKAERGSHLTETEWTGKIYAGASKSPSLFRSLKKLLSVSDEDLYNCVLKYGPDQLGRNEEYLQEINRELRKLRELEDIKSRAISPEEKAEKIRILTKEQNRILNLIDNSKDLRIYSRLVTRKASLKEQAITDIVNTLISMDKVSEENEDEGRSPQEKRRVYLKEAGVQESDIEIIIAILDKTTDKKEIRNSLAKIIHDAALNLTEPDKTKNASKSYSFSNAKPQPREALKQRSYSDEPIVNKSVVTKKHEQRKQPPKTVAEFDTMTTHMDHPQTTLPPELFPEQGGFEEAANKGVGDIIKKDPVTANPTNNQVQTKKLSDDELNKQKALKALERSYNSWINELNTLKKKVKSKVNKERTNLWASADNRLNNINIDDLANAGKDFFADPNNKVKYNNLQNAIIFYEKEFIELSEMRVLHNLEWWYTLKRVVGGIVGLVVFFPIFVVDIAIMNFYNEIVPKKNEVELLGRKYIDTFFDATASEMMKNNMEKADSLDKALQGLNPNPMKKGN